MKVAVFSTKPYDEAHLRSFNADPGHELTFFEPRLNARTAPLAAGHEVVCCFVNDILDADTLRILAQEGVRLVAMRCAGFNNVDLGTAAEVGIEIVRVPEYSPHAVAEHAVALILDLNRNIHRAYNRVREHDYSLNGLLGFDLHGKTVGVVGTGKIGATFARLMIGFGCRVLAYDPRINPEIEAMGGHYVELEALWAEADVISLHCPLMESTHHIVDAQAISKMKRGVMLINTSRGALVDTRAVIEGLKQGEIGYLGLDVYEEEADLFFEDFSNQVLQDDVFARLLTFPNVIITGHQAFFTREALDAIARVTLANISAFERDDAAGRYTVTL
ncbi:2-hydroxyacid dehydrogenase [Natronospirillum operosum]|uniref:2-hydroxyacid dehydrogenase n=1 Tax=Natronospirillum operosum TaxID=2759953 RepID=A0A4Z0WDV6_9GAMM|nr:2-hydroxyacid dehydrogenase [Natronospirillum operosum]TGG96014.1 2-hydroxyacid dehydrogenase [Natronospirillum operosum]